MAHDELLTRLLDNTDDLAQLSDRQLLQRIARAQDRLEQIVTQASEYLDQALDGLDQQLQGLQARLSSDAAELQAALEQIANADGEHQAIVEAVQRVQATADLVAGLALPSDVANPDTPAEATPVEPGADTNPDTGVDSGVDTGVSPVGGAVDATSGDVNAAPAADVDQSY